MSSDLPSVFLSYARADDEEFVRRMHSFLMDCGFRVWWDRVSMPSRSLTFHQEIRDSGLLLSLLGSVSFRKDHGPAWLLLGLAVLDIVARFARDKRDIPLMSFILLFLSLSAGISLRREAVQAQVQT